MHTFMRTCLHTYIHTYIVNSRFLQRPQKRIRGNQLIHKRLSKRKSIGSGSDDLRSGESSRQTDRRLLWMVFGVEMGRRVGRGEEAECVCVCLCVPAFETVNSDY